MNSVELEILSNLEVFNKSKWLALGEAVYELEKRTDSDPEQSSWLRVAVDHLSRAGDQIGMSYAYKVVRTYKALKRLAEDDIDLDPMQFDGCPIGAIEVATRIEKFDTAACKSALREIKRGASAADILKLYDNIKEKFKQKKDARNNAFGRNQAAVNASLDIVRRDISKFTSAAAKNVRISRVRTRQKTTGVGVSFYIRWLDELSVEKVTGFDVINIDNHSSTWYLHRARVSLNATFFSSLWIVCRSGEENIDFIKSDLHILGIQNVGIMNLAEDAISPFALLPTGSPVPNRTHLF